MAHFVISKQHLIQKALCMKKEIFNQSSKVSLTEKQVETYVNLVIAEIKKLQQKTNTFTFEVVSHSKVPAYSPITEEIKNAISKTKIYHDSNQKTYTSYNTAKELNLALSSFIPFGLKACLTPMGYKQALDLPKPNSKQNRRYKKASVQSNLASSNQNEEQEEFSQE